MYKHVYVFFFFFFFKQKTAYEITVWLEFRRVLFRSDWKDCWKVPGSCLVCPGWRDPVGFKVSAALVDDAPPLFSFVFWEMLPEIGLIGVLSVEVLRLITCWNVQYVCRQVLDRDQVWFYLRSEMTDHTGYGVASSGYVANPSLGSYSCGCHSSWDSYLFS